MTEHEKIQEALDGYINIMKSVSEDKEKEIYKAVGIDLATVANKLNETSKVKVKSIKAAKGPIISFGVMTSALVNTCKKRNRYDVIDLYKREIERLFTVFTTDKRYINLEFVNKKLEEHDTINIEYSALITNMFLNTASLLATKILLGQHLKNIDKNSKFVETYMLNNYIKTSDLKDVRQIMIKENKVKEDTLKEIK